MEQSSEDKTGIAWVSQNFAEFETRLNGGAMQVLHQERKDALARFLDRGFPSSQEEDWKYTNLQAFSRLSFAPPPSKEISIEQLKPFLIEGASGKRIVFVNGRFVSKLSSNFSNQPGIELFSIAELLKLDTTHPARANFESYAFRKGDFQNRTLVSLNTAFLSDGAFLRVKKGAVIDSPMQFLFVTTGEARQTVSYPRLLIVGKAEAQFSVIESYVSLGAEEYFTSAVSQCFLERGARLRQLKIQQESRSAFHLSNTLVEQHQDSYYAGTVVHVGGGLVRNEIETVLDGEECETHLYGLTLGRAAQHIDNTTIIDHAKPHCQSTERYRGIYRDQAKGVFFGTIIVRKDAQKTNAIQSNHSLLLSDTCSVDTRPQLKIWADDVRCTHGATVGQLDEQALFYLRSRGIDRKTAEDILVQAFATEVLDGVEEGAGREYLEQLLAANLSVKA